MSATVPASGKETPESSEWMPVGPDEADGELRKEAIACLKRKRKFIENVVGYVTVNGVLWLIWAVTDRSSDGGMPWPAWVSVIWGFFLAMEGWRAFGRWPRSLHRPITEADIEREMNRSRDS
ncbi:MAG: 2TM domain-containing protein [Gaiellaceae bacterium]